MDFTVLKCYFVQSEEGVIEHYKWEKFTFPRSSHTGEKRRKYMKGRKCAGHAGGRNILETKLRSRMHFPQICMFRSPRAITCS